MTKLIPLEQARAMAPAKMQDRINAGKAVNTNFSAGVRESFPILSIRGKVFRIRAEGKEEPYVDPATKQVIPFLDVVLVNSAPTLSKTYFIKGYDEADPNQQPDCWSLDAVRPDASVANKVNPTCADCPMNAFGSAPSRDGTKRGGKACQDGKRIAVTLPHNLSEPTPRLFMLKVPQTSHKNMKAYVELLARNGYEPGGCITRLSFDYNEAFPKLVFNFVGPLSDAEFDVVTGLVDDPSTLAMLAAPDFDMAQSYQRDNASSTEPIKPMQRQAPPVTVAANEERVNFDQQEQAEEEAVEVRTSTEGLIPLPDGSGWLDPATGEVVRVQAQEEPADEQEEDPDVVTMKDGRFFNKKTGAFVDSPYKVAPKVSKATDKAKPKGRGKKADADEPKPKVVAASAKLESLISEMVPPKN